MASSVGTESNVAPVDPTAPKLIARTPSDSPTENAPPRAPSERRPPDDRLTAPVGTGTDDHVCVELETQVKDFKAQQLTADKEVRDQIAKIHQGDPKEGFLSGDTLAWFLFALGAIIGFLTAWIIAHQYYKRAKRDAEEGLAKIPSAVKAQNAIDATIAIVPEIVRHAGPIKGFVVKGIATFLAKVMTFTGLSAKLDQTARRSFAGLESPLHDVICEQYPDRVEELDRAAMARLDENERVATERSARARTKDSNRAQKT
jgi:hypothetical protein